MTTLFRRFFERKFLLGAVVCVLTACQTVPLSQVSQFGTASVNLGESTRKALVLVNTASVERNLYDVASNPAKGPDDSTYEGFFSGQKGTIDGERKAQRLQVRLGALDALSRYSSALKALVGADFSADLDSAATELNASLIDLRKTYKTAAGKDLPITDGEIALIATTVNAIGKEIVEERRQSAVRLVLEKAEPSIHEITTLLSNDLGPGTELAEYARESLSNSRGSIQTAYNIERLKLGTTFEYRYNLLGKARQMFDAEQGVPDLFESLSEGIKSAGEAHSALVSVSLDDKLSEAKAAAAIGRIELYAKSVSEFYQSLNKNK